MVKDIEPSPVFPYTSYDHRHETGLNKYRHGHSAYTPPLEIYNCEDTIKDPVKFYIPVVKRPKGYFIGISGEGHGGVGGHYVFGLDVVEFWNILTK